MPDKRLVLVARVSSLYRPRSRRTLLGIFRVCQLRVCCVKLNVSSGTVPPEEQLPSSDVDSEAIIVGDTVFTSRFQRPSKGVSHGGLVLIVFCRGRCRHDVGNITAHPTPHGNSHCCSCQERQCHGQRASGGR
mmetsp:Transcript_1193/g.3928  ORF Transcript_1193/g.3928 Transcript_1193/m.3928 type:complete len:133 (-) Transcript_1193:1545-1943(-)